MKVKIALFFSILFTSLLIAPTIVSLADNTQNITIFLDMSEEEENKGEKLMTDSELKIQPIQNNSNLFLNGIQKKKNVRFQSKNYTSEYPKNTTPPPELA